MLRVSMRREWRAASRLSWGRHRVRGERPEWSRSGMNTWANLVSIASPSCVAWPLANIQAICIQLLPIFSRRGTTFSAAAGPRHHG
jgi:hypothetical protein